MNKNELAGFQCVCCGACCRWPGMVRVSEQEIDRIAAFLNIPVEQFIEKYTYLTPDRRSLSLTDQENGACCFYDNGTRLCRIQSVKPVQCAGFPHSWNNPGWEEQCAGAAKLKKRTQH